MATYRSVLQLLLFMALNYFCLMNAQGPDCEWVVSPNVNIVGGKVGETSNSLDLCQINCESNLDCVAIDHDFDNMAQTHRCRLLNKYTDKTVASRSSVHYDRICTVRGYCPEGWVFHQRSGFCYYVSDRYASAEVAQSYCVEKGATLVKIDNVIEMNYLWTLILKQRAYCTEFDNCKSYWTGLRFLLYDTDDVNTWRWNDGVPAASYGSTSYPYHLLMPPSACATIQPTNDDTNVQLVAQRCDENFKYICKMNCPSGFTHWPPSNTCYKLVTEKLTWNGARDRCRSISIESQLVAITSADQSKGIANYLTEQLSRDPSLCRAGLEYSLYDETSLFWTSGRRNGTACGTPHLWKPYGNVWLNFTYQNWAPGNPDCPNYLFPCVVVPSMEHFQWRDEDCDVRACPICEIATRF